MRPFAFLLLLPLSPLLADEVTLNSGRVLKGEVLSEDDGKVVLKAASGTLEIPRNQIASVKRERYEPPPARAEEAPSTPPAPSKPSRPRDPAAPDEAEIRSRLQTALEAFGKLEPTEDSDAAETDLASLGPAAVPFLVAALKDQPAAPSVHLVRALGRLQGPEASEALLTQLSSPHGEVRSAAALALGGRGDREAIDPLTALLKDGDWTVRRDAAAALAALKAKAAVPALLELLSDVNLYVRAQAQASLKQITEVDLGFDPAAWKAWVEANPDFFR